MAGSIKVVSFWGVALCAVGSLASSSGHHAAVWRGPVLPARVPFVGRVSAIDVPGAVVVLAHDAIPGYGPAGRLTLRVEDTEALTRFSVGDGVQASMIVTAGRDVVLEHVVVTRRDRRSPDPGSGGRPEENAPRDWGIVAERSADALRGQRT